METSGAYGGASKEYAEKQRVLAEEQRKVEEAERAIKYAERQARIREENERRKSETPPPGDGEILGATNLIQICKSGDHFLLLVQDAQTQVPRGYLLRDAPGVNNSMIPVENANFLLALETALSAFRKRVNAGVMVFT